MEVVSRNLPHDVNHTHHGCDSIADQFDYFSQIPLEVAQVGCIDGYVRPVSGINDTGPFTFVLEPQSHSFLKLNSLNLYAKYRVVKADGSKLDDDEDVAIVNNFASSVWRQTEVLLNDVEWYGGSAVMSNMKSYLETILSYEESSRDTHLRTSLFHMDSPGKFDTFADNTGYTKRKAYIAKSREFDCVCPLNHDFVRNKNHLMPGVKLSVRLSRASDEFLLLTSTDNAYKLEIKELRLYYERLQLTPAMTTKIMSTSPHNMLGNRTEMKSFALPTGLTEKTITLTNGGILPKTLVVVQVDTAALHGGFKSNPFNFKHNKLNRINLRVNGTSVPSDGYRPDFTNDLVMREYNALFMNTGIYRVDRGNCVSLEAFKGGSTIMVWDLTEDKCAMHHGK